MRSAWPSHCPPPRDLSFGTLWENLNENAEYMPERAAPSVLLKRDAERRLAPEPIAVDAVDPKPYRRQETLDKTRAEPWVFYLQPARRRRR